MNIYLVSQTDIEGYDSFDAFVCYAMCEEDAANTLPSSSVRWDDNYKSWASSPSKVTVKYLGTCTASNKSEAGVILASYNAG